MRILEGRGASFIEGGVVPPEIATGDSVRRRGVASRGERLGRHVGIVVASAVQNPEETVEAACARQILWLMEAEVPFTDARGGVAPSAQPRCQSLLL